MFNRRWWLWVGLWASLTGCGRAVEEISVDNAGELVDLGAVSAAEDDWPWWRGPSLDGRARGPAPPIRWDSQRNVIWKTAVPGQGHASPCVCGDSVLLATADEATATMSLVCLDRATGGLRWQKELHRGGFMHKHQKNSHASATPACDGERVFTVFMVGGGIQVSAVSLDGEVLWQRKAGDFTSMHGYGSSPLVHASLVVVAGDNSGGGFLAALHRQTGQIVWRVRRQNVPSFATPVTVPVAGRPQVLLSGQEQVVAYDPASGRQEWSSAGPARTTANTMVWNDSLVFASGGYPERAVMAMRPGGEVVWQQPIKAYVPSLLCDGERLLVTQDNGIVSCHDTAGGELLWKERVGADISASPVQWDDRVYLSDERGRTYVFRWRERYELLATNDLGETIFATPAICGGRIYLRTRSHMYCLGITDAELPARGEGPGEA